MSDPAPDGTAVPLPRQARFSLLDRKLAAYPSAAARYRYLTIVVLATVVLYYQAYVQHAVSTAIMTHYHMTFTYFSYVSVASNAAGAFAALLAGLSDRWGRANFSVYGLLVVGLLMVFGVPNAPDKTAYLLLTVVVGMVEGAVLVTTPALVRDFSPQLGRASAMGFWTMGPVVGSLVVTVVANRTYTGSTTWQDELRYAGMAGLVVFVIALLGLRELAKPLRDQVVVSTHDRALVQARARGLDSGPARSPQRRRMLRADIVAPALGIGLFLLLYFAAVGSFTVYFVTVYHQDLRTVAGLLNWYWAANAICLIAVGRISDRAHVRKPFMVIGALGSAAVLVPFALDATRPTTSHATLALLLTGMGVFGALAYAPWMAAFTETVERRDPAAVATGLSVYGWIIRIIAAASIAVLPLVVTNITPLVDHGSQVTAAQEKAAPALAVIAAHPDLFAQLGHYPAGTAPAALKSRARSEVGPSGLKTVQDAAAPLAVLKTYGPDVKAASAAGPRNWQHWWWVCLAGQLLFIPTIFALGGPWRHRRARTSPAGEPATTQAT